MENRLAVTCAIGYYLGSKISQGMSGREERKLAEINNVLKQIGCDANVESVDRKC